MEKSGKLIIINSESKVSDFQKRFTLCYPYLKIEFAKGSQLSKAQKNLLDPATCIEKVAAFTEPVIINIAGTVTIAALEEEIFLKFGLNIQVYRKSGKIWNVISITNSWNLESQNNAGEFISLEMSEAS